MKWKAFDRWATRQGYTFTTQGQGDESIVGVIGTTPDGETISTNISTGRHNSPNAVPDRLIQEIASRLQMSKHSLEDLID